MLLTSFLFVLAMGGIAYSSVALSLFAPIPFTPAVFPVVFVLVALAAIYFAPRARVYLSLPEAPPDASASRIANPPYDVKKRIQTWASNSLLYATLIPLACLLLFLPALQIGYHGLFHSAYVYDILLRGLPPENVTLPGYPANDYWPYHVYLALLTRLFDIPPTFASALSNIVVLAFSCLWISALWKTLRRQSSAPTAFHVLFPLLGANLFYAFNVKIADWASALPPLAPYSDLLRAADSRLDISIIRFANFNGFSIGILFFLASLVTAIRLLQDKPAPKDINLLFFLAGSALLFHATTGLFLLLVVIPALIWIRLSAAPRPLTLRSFLTSSGLANWRGILAPSLFLLVPGLFLLRAAAAMPIKTSLEWTNWTDWSSIFVSAYPIAPLFFLGLSRAWKGRDPRVLFLSLVSLWGFLLAVFVKFPDGNEYKFIYLSSVAFAIVAVFHLDEFVSRPGSWRKGLLAFFALVLAYNIGSGTQFFHDMYRRRHKPEIVYQGIYVSIAQKDFAPFEWIRENTPVDTIVVSPFTSKDWNYEYFSARLPYVVAGHIYNEGFPETALRRKTMEDIYDPLTPMETKMKLIRQIAETIRRPLAVVYSADREFYKAMQQTFGVRGQIVNQTAIVYLLELP